ncbi:MAG: helicase-related protein [Candidatus Thermoplasmatota archaeon]
MDKIPSLIDTEVIERREYQLNIFGEIKEKDSLVVLPTGLGKTAIAMYLVADSVEDGKKVLMMAPTRPLCQQHLDFIEDSTALKDEDTGLITGELYGQKEREELWKEDREVFVATPQTVNNDLHILPLSEFGLMVFDETHRAVGDYAYVEIAKACKGDMQFLGLTASPGSSFEKLIEVCYNLGIEHLELRTEEDEDVEPYVADRRLNWIEIEKSEELETMERWLNSMLQEFLDDLSEYTKQARNMKAENVGKKALIETQETLQKRIKRGKGNKGYLFHAMSLTSASIKTAHLKELLLTQGIDAAHRYLLRLQEEDDRSSKYVTKKKQFGLLNDKLMDLKAMPVETNPKLTETKKILTEELSEGRAMVFAQYRDTVDYLIKELKQLDGIEPARLIGQADKGDEAGMSQKEQKSTLEAFKEGTNNVLVCTRIGEEGLDIPATELVVFYEPVPSAIRSIQRKGRTGRDRRAGKIYVLISKDTKDEAFYWKSRHAEKEMFEHVYRLKRGLEKGDDPEKVLEELMDEEVGEQSTLEKFS